MEKKVVSPFEFALTEIIDPEAAKTMRPETLSEKSDRLEREFRETMGRMRIINQSEKEQKP